MPPVRYHHGGFPPKNLDWSRLVPLLGPASAALARYDGVLEAVPNANVLLSPLTTREAVLSSKIEGTQATMGEVLEYEAGAVPEAEAKPEKVADIHEILNYRMAIRQAVEQLDKLPLSGRLICAAHKTLLQGVRGQNRAPGYYRTTQNWIGQAGSKEKDARFVPIEPGQALETGISTWEKYIHTQQPDALVQLAVAHAEFESLHPFLDGNGRLGRMLIPLYLFNCKLLATPTFYLSEYLEAQREEYYDRLLAVSRDKDWTGWCVFFLKAMATQAEANTHKARAILKLYEEKKIWVADQTHSQHAIRAMDFIFDRPMFRSSDFIDQAGIPETSAKRILKVLTDIHLVHTIRKGSGRRSSTLAFSELLNIVEGQKVF
jgi:Fic family protein